MKVVVNGAGNLFNNNFMGLKNIKEYKYIFCFKDGTYIDIDYKNDIDKEKFCKKGKCYKLIGDYFINELKEAHFFGEELEDEESEDFFKNHFLEPIFKHLIIEKKM